MATPDFKAQRKAKREARMARADRLKKWVPLIQSVCQRYGIEIKEIPNGFQFRVREYILNWWLPTNLIMVQYTGSGETKKFEADDVPGEPKILTALKKLIRVTKGEETLVMTKRL